MTFRSFFLFFICLVLCGSVFVSAQQLTYHVAYQAPELFWLRFAHPVTTPGIQAEATILLDLDRDDIIFAQNSEQKLPPASLTKIMTILIALENQDKVDEYVKVELDSIEISGSTLGLKHGELIPFKSLIIATLYRSGNDGALVLARHVAGSEEQFVELMNGKADVLGMKNTNFTNVHGLDDEGHYSTAYDLALLTKAALANNDFATLVAQRSAEVGLVHQTDDAQPVEYLRKINNNNSFLWRFPDATGVKLGYTQNAGFCLIASAQRDEKRLLLVLLGAKTTNQRWLNAIDLMEFGFSQIHEKNCDKLAD